MNKKIFVGLLSASLVFSGVTADAARYFMQGENVGSKIPYGDNLKVGKFVQADDAKIYYEVYGKGEPILILHGGGVGTPYEMGKIIDELKKNHQVVGHSETGHSPLTYEQKAADILAVVEKITDKPIQILGFSDGAYGAYKFAAMYPEKVERIAAIGAGTLKAGFFPAGGLKIDELAKFDSQFIEEQKKIRPESENWQDFCDDYMNFWHNQSVGEEIFGKIKCPVLLIVGDEDDHAPVITVLQAHQIIPNSRLCVVPKAWHAAFLDNYEVTAAAIFPFVNAKLNDLKPSKKVEYNSQKEG